MCFLALAITFCSLRQNWARGLLKTCAFIAAWPWTFRPCSQVDGCSSLLSSMVTLWCVCKCCIKLYLVVYDASHPSTLQTNLGPSFAQCTPSMAIGGRATTSMLTPSMATRGGETTSMVTPSMAIGGGATTSQTKKTNTINLMWVLTFWMKVIFPQWRYCNYRHKIKHTIRVLQKWITGQKFKMRVLLKPSFEICIEWSNLKNIYIIYKVVGYCLKIQTKTKCPTHLFTWRRKVGQKFGNQN